MLNRFCQKVNKKIKIVCLDLNGLIALNETLLTPKYLDIINKEKDRFVVAFRTLLDSKGFISGEDMTKMLEAFRESTVVEKMDEHTFTKE